MTTVAVVAAAHATIVLVEDDDLIDGLGGRKWRG
jgi:hypothetical protein